MPTFNLKLTFNEAGTVYAALKLAAETLANSGGTKEADEINRLANRLLPEGDAAVYD
jgi:hypothetical protein